MREHSYKNELLYSILKTFNSDDIFDLCEELSIIKGEEIKCDEIYEVRAETHIFYYSGRIRPTLFFKIWLDQDSVPITMCGNKEDYYLFYKTLIKLSRNVKINNILEWTVKDI
jgi:hypothetical protein